MTPTDTDHGYINLRVLKINVGYLITEGPGFSRDIQLDIPGRLNLSEDLTLFGLKAELRLTRTSEGILLQGTSSTQLTTECTRCLRPTEITFEVPLEELYALEPNEQIEFEVDDDNAIDLAPLIREETLLNMPVKVHCQRDCLGLCPTCGQNLNDGNCDCESEQIDPRWAALAKLKDQLSEDDVR